MFSNNFGNFDNVKYSHKRRGMVAIYSIAHFLVDFSCIFLMFRSIAGTNDWYLYILLYNFFAFACQMPLGLIADACNRNYLFAAGGCISIGLAYGFSFVPVVAVIVLGIGNALFHIGGGIDILNISERKSAALGIFVSPGALGVYFGTLVGKGNAAVTVIILAALLATAVLIVAIRYIQGKDYSNNAVLSLTTAKTRTLSLAIICLFLVVCLRSYVGATMDFSWKGIGHWSVILVCAVVLGKTLGGFAADRLGAIKTTLFSLSIAALLFFFSQIPLSGLFAVLLFNMTMPITLWMMAKIFPGAKGFSFGLLTFALFLGFLPVYFGLENPSDSFWVFSLAAVISMLFLVIGLKRSTP